MKLPLSSIIFEKIYESLRSSGFSGPYANDAAEKLTKTVLELVQPDSLEPAHVLPVVVIVTENIITALNCVTKEVKTHI